MWYEFTDFMMPSDPSPSIDPRIVQALRRAQRIAVLTGAGVSAESGVPTFRDKQTGLWEKFDAAELATPAAFQRDPALVWGWYEWRRMRVRRAEPNAAHRAIAAMGEHAPQFTLITQNVDDLHERAGSPRLLHLHGELARPYCEACRQTHALPDAIPELPEGGMRIEPPGCAACGARVRPGVVWFGETLPQLEWLSAVEATRQCELFFSVGTSSVVWPAAALVDIATRAEAVTVQVNPNPTGNDAVFTFVIPSRAGPVLAALVNQAWNL